MKRVIVIMVVGLVLGLSISSSAWCDGYGGHGGGSYHGGGHYHGGGYYHGGRGYYGYYGGYFGFPYYYPGYYPYYYPYAYPTYPSYPDPSTSTEPPVTYGAPEQNYWYYCKDAQAYYPYVASCPGGWMRVVPTPPPPGKEEIPAK